MILDGGPVGHQRGIHGVDVTEEIPVMLRPGAVTMENASRGGGEKGTD